MIDRRTFMLTSVATVLMPRAVTAGTRADTSLSWTEYLDEMKQLATAYADKAITQGDMAARGVQLLQQLEVQGERLFRRKCPTFFSLTLFI